MISLGTIGTRQQDLDTLVGKLQGKGQALHFGDAAGPGGYWRYRYLPKKGLKCWGVAPAQIPQKAGERGKSDRREAGQRARRLRSGDLRPVDLPRGEAEAIREVVRAREDGLKDLKAAQVRRKAVLLRQDMRDEGRAKWTAAQLRWLANVVCPPPAQPLGFPE